MGAKSWWWGMVQQVSGHPIARQGCGIAGCIKQGQSKSPCGMQGLLMRQATSLVTANSTSSLHLPNLAVPPAVFPKEPEWPQLDVLLPRLLYCLIQMGQVGSIVSTLPHSIMRGCIQACVSPPLCSCLLLGIRVASKGAQAAQGQQLPGAGSWGAGRRSQLVGIAGIKILV